MSEVFATMILDSASPYPGHDSLFATADGSCIASFAAYVGVEASASSLQIGFFVPTETLWGRGDRTVTCIAYERDGSQLHIPIKDARI